jgi:hypothetical protein
MQLIKSILGADVNKLNLSYIISDMDIKQEAKEQNLTYSKTLRQVIFEKCKPGWTINLPITFDLIESKQRKVISQLSKFGFPIKFEDPYLGSTPFIWACYMKDLATVKFLIEDIGYKP